MMQDAYPGSRIWIFLIPDPDPHHCYGIRYCTKSLWILICMYFLDPGFAITLKVNFCSSSLYFLNRFY
jgi:hypothetical protein